MSDITRYPNLKPFRPGAEWTGNRKGRPPSRTLTALLREVLDGNELCGQAMPDGRTVAQTLVEAALRHAIEGDAGLIREVLRRVDGAAPESPAHAADDVSRLTDEELLAALTEATGGSGEAGPDVVAGDAPVAGEPAG